MAKTEYAVIADGPWRRGLVATFPTIESATSFDEAVIWIRTSDGGWRGHDFDDGQAYYIKVEEENHG